MSLLTVCLGFLTGYFAAPTLPTDSVQLTYYGHSAFKLTTPSGRVLLIDPWITNPNNPSGEEDLATLDSVDFILVSHGHFDHVGNAAAIARRTGAQLVATDDLGMGIITYAGYPNLLATAATRGNFGGTISLLEGEVTVTFVPAVHSSAITPLPKGAENLHNGGAPSGLLIRVRNGPTLYHTGDTDVFSDMALIAPDITTLLVCIGGYATMGPKRAAQAVGLVAPDQVIPIHYGTFPSLTGTPQELRKAMIQQEIDVPVKVMQPHQTLYISQ